MVFVWWEEGRASSGKLSSRLVERTNLISNGTFQGEKQPHRSVCCFESPRCPFVRLCGLVSVNTMASSYQAIKLFFCVVVIVEILWLGWRCSMANIIW